MREKTPSAISVTVTELANYMVRRVVRHDGIFFPFPPSYSGSAWFAMLVGYMPGEGRSSLMRITTDDLNPITRL